MSGHASPPSRSMLIAAAAISIGNFCFGAPAPAASLVVRDDLRREVAFAHDPQRLISLMPSLKTEIV